MTSSITALCIPGRVTIVPKQTRIQKRITDMKPLHIQDICFIVLETL